MQNFLEEFKTFALKGNVLDLAVGVVIGTAFNAIVDSLVKDVIMQAIAMLFKQPDFGSILIGSIRIGAFINQIVNFLIVSLSVFVAIKAMNKFLVKKNTSEPTK
ncbi:MAG: large conductance mechanosensitive channel protein MscL [Candidatus Taylorbacteria bacterium]|nr:large conductance mechanosensitive channel protein MscL [Candidatus Taylorbacteria bacterium]